MAERTVLLLVFEVLLALMAVLMVPLVQRKVKPNWLYGLRTHATLRDERVWYEANYRTARMMIVVSVGTMVVVGGLYPVRALPLDAYAAVCSLLLLASVLFCALRGIAIANALSESEGRGRGSRD